LYCHQHHAGRVAFDVDKIETVPVLNILEERLAFTDDHRMDRKSKFVNEIEIHKAGYQLAAAVEPNVLSGLRSYLVNPFLYVRVDIDSVGIIASLAV
jgi:hypothetical protein